jgi:hypothetical protein
LYFVQLLKFGCLTVFAFIVKRFRVFRAPLQQAMSVSRDIIQNSVQEASRLSSEDLRVLDDMGL